LLVKEGDACLLSCKAEGNPLPTVQWFKDDICIDNSPQYQITYNNGEALLKIEHTNSSTHRGKYTCVATNRLGSDSTASKLLIDGKYTNLQYDDLFSYNSSTVFVTTISSSGKA